MVAPPKGLERTVAEEKEREILLCHKIEVAAKALAVN
jgi:hypothetical protein